MDNSERFLEIVNDAKSRVHEISVSETRKRLNAGKDIVFIDVREDHEWAQGRARGAIHLGKGIIERDIEERVPDQNAALVLYCGGGFRSALAADNLQKMGYTNVESMDGGWKGWLDAGLPTAKG
jgi:rhodanese-related sulfurtransferase